MTQYNTAHNRQISMIGITENEKVRKRKYRPHSVSFSDSEEIINPGNEQFQDTILSGHHPIRTPFYQDTLIEQPSMRTSFLCSIIFSPLQRMSILLLVNFAIWFGQLYSPAREGWLTLFPLLSLLPLPPSLTLSLVPPLPSPQRARHPLALPRHLPHK